MTRQVNPVFDVPSLFHKFYYKLSIPYIKNKKVLDIGCWSGMYESMAVAKANHITGIDPSVNAINMAKKLVPEASFYVGRAEKLDFKDNSFDTVIFSEVIEHISKGSEERAIKEVFRVLKPGGYLLLTTPRNHLLSILLDPAYFLIGHRHYSAEFLKDLFEKNGFKIKYQAYYGGVCFLVVSNLEILFKHLLGIKFEPPEFIKKMITLELKNGFSGNVILAQKK